MNILIFHLDGVEAVVDTEFECLRFIVERTVRSGGKDFCTRNCISLIDGEGFFFGGDIVVSLKEHMGLIGWTLKTET